MGADFSARMLRRQEKNSPGFNPPKSISNDLALNKSRERKWRQSNMLLAFAPIMPASLIEKTIKRLKKNAPSGAADQSAHYALWIKLHDRSSTRDRIKARKYLRKMPCPRISIVMPVYNTPSRWLEKAIKSVRGQLYENWELCIADDASTDAHVREILNRYAAKDPRIKVHYRTENGHISACSNDALALATRDYVGFWITMTVARDSTSPCGFGGKSLPGSRHHI